MARTITKGYAKIYSLLTRIKVEDKDNLPLKFLWPGNSCNAYEFEPTLYNVDGLFTQIHKDIDKSTIISIPYGDYFKLKPSQITIEYTLIVSFNIYYWQLYLIK